MMVVCTPSYRVVIDDDDDDDDDGCLHTII